MRIYKYLIFLSTLALVLAAGLTTLGWAAERGDHSVYAELLGKYVKEGIVDYQGFKNEESKLDRYLKVLENMDTKGLLPNEQMAFYINAYNGWTIKLILTRYPDVKSIWDLGSRVFRWNSPFKKKIARIEGKEMSLDDIEHGILRRRFKDPRVHFAVNCASKSCPPLRSEPYRGEILDRQLDEATRAFINDPRNNRLKGKTLYVSSIFKWFKEDFGEDIVGFFLKFAHGDLKKELESERGQIEVEYLDYDWSLNGI